MKILKYLAFSALVALSLTSCDKTTEGMTDVLYYPVITLDGGNVVLSVGDEYEEPGFSAALGEEDLTDKVEVINDVDTSTPGFYTVIYSVADKDGHVANETRTVFVNNPGHFDNIYWGESKNKSYHFWNAPILIEDNGDGTYLINDLIGGFYSYGRYPGYDVYGYDFFVESLLSLDGSNVILLEEGDWFFYDENDPTLIVESDYNAEAGTVHLGLNYWDVHLVAITADNCNGLPEEE